MSSSARFLHKSATVDPSERRCDFSGPLSGRKYRNSSLSRSLVRNADYDILYVRYGSAHCQLHNRIARSLSSLLPFVVRVLGNSGERPESPRLWAKKRRTCIDRGQEHVSAAARDETRC